MASHHPSLVKPVWIVGFTGHRPRNVPGRTVEDLARLQPMLAAQFQKLADQAAARGGTAQLLCGMAAGADLAAARAARSIGMTVHVILPQPEEVFYKSEGFAQDPAAQAEVSSYVDAAKNGIGGATFRVVRGTREDPECYYDLGMQIVEASDAVIAVWNQEAPPPVGEDEDEENAGRGGTADVVALALADRMPYLKKATIRGGYEWLSTPHLIINPATGATEGDLSKFACEKDAGFAEILEVEHAASRRIGASATPQGDMAALLHRLDNHARDWAFNLRACLVACVTLHGLASLAAASSASWQVLLAEPVRHHFSVGLTSLELVLICIAVGVALLVHWRHGQARWIELRLATELLRGHVAAGPLLDPLFPLVTRHLPGWRRFSLSVGLNTAAGIGQSWHLKDEIQRYQKERIQDQIAHFSKGDPATVWWFRIARRTGVAASWLAVVVVLLALLHKLHLDHHLHIHLPSLEWEILVYKFLPIALPLFAGVAAALQAVNDAPRRAQVYPEIVERLQSVGCFASAIRTKSGFRRVVARTEEVLIDELMAWYAASKSISH